MIYCAARHLTCHAYTSVAYSVNSTHSISVTWQLKAFILNLPAQYSVPAR